jgi:hypothetical protein
MKDCIRRSSRKPPSMEHRAHHTLPARLSADFLRTTFLQPSTSFTSTRIAQDTETSGTRHGLIIRHALPSRLFAQFPRSRSRCRRVQVSTSTANALSRATASSGFSSMNVWYGSGEEPHQTHDEETTCPTQAMEAGQWRANGRMHTAVQAGSENYPAVFSRCSQS